MHTAGQQLLVQDEPGLDRLPEPHLVGEQDAGCMTPGNLMGDIELVRQEEGAWPQETAHSRMIQAIELSQRAVTQLEQVVLIKLATQESLAWPAELDVAVEHSFGKLAPAAIITPAEVSQEAILLLHRIDHQLPALDRAHAVAG